MSHNMVAFCFLSFFILSFLFPDQSAVNTARTDTIEMIQDQDHFKCKLDLPRGNRYLWGRGGEHAVILSNVTLHGADTPYGLSTVPPNNNTYSSQAVAISSIEDTTSTLNHKEGCAKDSGRISSSQ